MNGYFDDEGEEISKGCPGALHKNIVKGKIVKAMRISILGGASVAIGRTMYVLQKVTLKVIFDSLFFGKICYNFYIITIFYCLRILGVWQRYV